MGTTVTSPQQSRQNFERIVEDLQAWANGIIATLPWDAALRTRYQTAIRAATDNLRREAQSGAITWEQAATQAQQLRNDLMQVIRARSSPIGRAVAEFIKSEGKTLNELVARYALKRFGPDVVFDSLAQADKDLVYADIVAAAARSNPSVNAMVLRIGRVSRGLIILSLAISVYEVATSDHPLQTAEREGALTLSGIGGGIAGGALAGLACGPGAPVCVTVGAFVGGALAVLGVSLVWH